ncbi:MAG: hypothetical protein F6K39_24860 [Okeania sp. SIO3B3]|nr:hypothetical protein [Okeania sp. SIO3B3]
MSGEKRKYVSVEEQELRRLRQQESRLRSVQQDLPERLNAVREQARQEFQQRLAPLENRARQQEQETQRLKSGLKDLEKQTQKRLQKQRQEFQTAVRESESRQQQALQQETNRLESAMRQGFEEQRREYLQISQQQRKEYIQLLEQQDAKFTELISEERQARQEQIKQVVANIEEERERKAQLASDMLADVETVWEQINRDYQHERFAPGRLADLRRGLEMARSNIQSGVSEAAIANAQQTYLDLADLRLELEQKEQEWQLFYNAAWEDLQSLITEVQANRECEIEVGQGSDAEKFKFEVDYWVDGRLSEYEKQLAELESQLKAGESTLTTEEVKQLGEEITALQPTLGEIMEQAKLSILGSQLRAEIADRVVEVLDSLGYTLVNSDDAVYEGDDERNAYVVKVKNIAGDEVVTVISPEREFGANSVSINSFSETLVDEKATQENAKAIFDSLEQGKVQGVGDVECKQEARQDYYNIEEVKQRQSAEKRSPSSGS